VAPEESARGRRNHARVKGALCAALIIPAAQVGAAVGLSSPEVRGRVTISESGYVARHFAGTPDERISPKVIAERVHRRAILAGR
jgi:hypothetical protein